MGKTRKLASGSSVRLSVAPGPRRSLCSLMPMLVMICLLLSMLAAIPVALGRPGTAYVSLLSLDIVHKEQFALNMPPVPKV